MTYRNPVYLGDGAYAQVNALGDLVLSTGSHVNGSCDVVDIICLEGNCVQQLLDYIDKHAPNGSQNYTIKRIGT